MKLFLQKITFFTLIGLIPILISLIGYFSYDPFKVLKPYTNYSNSYIIPNRDYVSTEIFIKNTEEEISAFATAFTMEDLINRAYKMNINS